MSNKKFTASQGQAWDQASLANLGSEKLMGAVIAENPEDADALLFGGGAKLEMPEIKPRAVVSLPPWEKM